MGTKMKIRTDHILAGIGIGVHIAYWFAIGPLSEHHEILERAKMAADPNYSPGYEMWEAGMIGLFMAIATFLYLYPLTLITAGLTAWYRRKKGKSVRFFTTTCIVLGCLSFPFMGVLHWISK